MFWNIIIAVASYFLNLVLAPKPQNAKPASLEDFDIPTAEEGIEIPVVFGTVSVKNPNVMWYGDLDTDAIRGARRYGFFGPRQILGYQYQIGMHMILCHGVHDEILRIWVADKLLWEGRAGGTTALQIDEKEFFGGDDKEGGIWGQVDFMDGNPGQGQNDYLVAKLGVGAITPAFRGVVSVVWRRGGADMSGLHIGNNPYVKPWEFELKRIHRTSEGAEQWYDNTAAIPDRAISIAEYGPDSVALNDPLADGFSIGDIFTGYDTGGEWIAVIFNQTGTHLRLWHLPDGAVRDYTRTIDYSDFDLNFGTSVFFTDYDELMLRESGNYTGSKPTLLTFRNPDGLTVLQSINLAPYSGANDSNGGFGAGQYHEWLVLKLGGGSWATGNTNWVVLQRSGDLWNVVSSHAGTSNERAQITVGPIYAYADYGSGAAISRLRYNSGAWEEVSISRASLGIPVTISSLQYVEDSDEVVVVSSSATVTYVQVFDAALTTLRRTLNLHDINGETLDAYRGTGRMMYSNRSIILLLLSAITTPPTYARMYEIQVSDLRILRNINIGQTTYVNKDRLGGFLFAYRFFYNRQMSGAFVNGHATGTTSFWPIPGAEGTDMNPAHIIRECLTDPIWGMGYHDADIDDTSFMTAADTLYAEAFGLSLQWNREEKIEEFISVILAHIDAYLYLRRTTGMFYLKLIRDDYDLASLPVFDEDDVVSWDEISRREPAEAINSVIVKYTDRQNRGKDASHQVDNIAQIQQLGERISATRFYPGISRGSLAVQVAGRDQRSLGIGLISGRVDGKRTFDILYPGDPFRLVSSRQNLDGEVMRVASMKFGDGRDNKITVQFVEDVFRLGAPDLVDTAQGDWEIPTSLPAAVYPRLVWEAPYWHLLELAGPSDTSLILAGNPDAGVLVMAGGKPTADAVDAKVYVDGIAVEALNFAPAGTLGLAIMPLDTAITLDNKTGTFTVGALAAIISSAGPRQAEIVQILTVAGADLTLSRGLVDTIPKNHAAGDSFVVFDGFSISDFEIRDDSETPAVRLLTRTARSMLKYAVAPEDVVDMDSRAIRPLRPANVRVEGLPIGPIDGIGLPNFDVSWAERNRLTDINTPMAWADATSVADETGQDTVIEVLDSDKIVVRTQTVPGGTTTYSVPIGWFTDPIGWIRVGSERDGYREWQGYAIEVYTEEIDFLTLDADELTLGGESLYFA
jgi:hypothetical protein